jgi:hypothetical protein
LFIFFSLISINPHMLYDNRVHTRGEIVPCCFFLPGVFGQPYKNLKGKKRRKEVNEIYVSFDILIGSAIRGKG